MNMNMNEKRGRAAIIAAVAVLMLAAVCFVGVGAGSEDVEGVPVAPSADPFTGMYVSGGESPTAQWDNTNKVFRVNTDTTIMLNGDVGTAAEPYDFRIVIAADATLTFNLASGVTEATIYIDYSSNGAEKNVIAGASSGTTSAVVVNGNITLDLSVSKDAGVATDNTGNYNVIANTNVTLTDGATMILGQANGCGGIAFYNGNNAGISATDSAIVLDHAGGIAGVVNLNNSTLTATNVKNGLAFITFEGGSSVSNDSIITIEGCDDGTKANINFKGTASITDSAINAGGAGVRMENAAAITATGTTINAGEVFVKGDSAEATLTGAIVNADIGADGTGATMNLTSVTIVGNHSVTDAMTIDVNGVVVTGTFNAAGSDSMVVTIDTTGNLVAASGSSVTLPSGTDISNIYAASGATVTGVTVEDNKDTMNVDGDSLALYADSGLALTSSSTVNVNGDVTLSNGTTYTISNGITISAGKFTVGSDAEFRITNEAITATAQGASITGRVVFGAVPATQGLGADAASMTFDEFMGQVSISGTTVTITDADAGVLTIVSGAASISATEIPAGVTLNVQKNVTITFTGGALAVNGTLNQYGRLEGTSSGTSITVNNGGVFNAMSGATYDNISVGGTGTINMGGAMNDATLTGVYSTSTTFALNQNMVVSGTLTVTGQATLYINGGLEIPEGTTVYIEEGSRIIVQGGVAEVVIAGTLNVYETGTFQVTGSKSVEISGTIISEESSTINIAGPTELTGNASITAMGSFTANNGLEIGANATLNLQGAADIDGAKNSGTIVFDEATVSTTRTTIQMTGNGAVVNIISVQLTSGGSLSVSDSALAVTNATVENDNAVTFTTGNGNVAVEGVTITESFQTETRNGQTYVDNSLAAAGNMSVDRGDSTVAFGNITFEGANVRVTDTLNIDENIAVSVSGANTELFVDGTMTMADGVVMTLYGGAEVTVNGQITSYKEITINQGAINAIYYRTTAEPRNTYTNLADAVANNSASTTVVTLEVMGTVVVEEDVSIPAVIRTTGDGTLQVGTEDVRGITVDFADGAEFRGVAIVYATLHFDNNRNDRGTISSDVVINNGSERTYTNVATAIAGSQPGDVVTITGTDVTITSDLTIPEQVTLMIPLGSIVTVNDNVTVTVNGTINTQTGLVAANEFGERADDDTSRLVVNGTFMTTESGELSTLYVKYSVAGAYYQLLTDSGMYKFIQPVSVAAESDATTITIFGENTVGDVTFTGTEDERVVVTIAPASTAAGAEYDAAELIAGTVTLSYATLDVDGRFNGTVATAEGAIDVVNATGFVAVSSEINDEPVYLVSGTVSKFDNSENADDASFAVATGVVTVNATTLTVNSLVEFTVADGATLTATGQSSIIRAGSVTVNGTLTAENGGAANITEIYVLGIFTVGAADNSDGIVAGSSNVQTLYIGIDDEWIVYEGAAVNANTSLGSLTTIYLAAGNTVSEAQTDGKKTTAYNVQGELYMTVYTTDRTLGIVTVETPVLDGVYAQYWQYDNNGKMAEVTTQKVGEIPTVSAYIVEDVYLVTLTVESGISDVYIDGDLVATSGLSGGDLLAVMLPMGEHTVTYRLDNGFSGTVTMTINGQTMTDGKFTLSADMPYLKDDVDYHGDLTVNDFVVYNIVITGVEATGPSYSTTTSGDDGLGLTDYLLIILVVLIVVMAIMVAMRLMRS